MRRWVSALLVVCMLAGTLPALADEAFDADRAEDVLRGVEDCLLIDEPVAEVDEFELDALPQSETDEALTLEGGSGDTVEVDLTSEGSVYSFEDPAAFTDTEVMAASKDDAKAVTKAAAKISVPKSIALGLKESYAFGIKGVKGVTYKSSKTAIASVDKKGKITGKKAGSATITVLVDGKKTATCKVTVKSAPKKIALSRNKRKMYIGTSILLPVTLSENSASKITWTSSNKSVAKVSADGVVTALKKGSAKITAKTFNKKKATCKITVSDAPSMLRLKQDSVTLSIKETTRLVPIVNKGAKAKYSWSAKNKKIATVNKHGVVTGVKAGTTTVTVKTQNGLAATVKVKVLAAPKKITLSKTKAELAEGTTLRLTAKLPAKTFSNIIWSSNKAKVATVDEDGLVTAVAPGTAKITAKTFNGKKAVCTVTVKEASIADHLSSFYDAYEEDDKAISSVSTITVKKMAPETFKDSEALTQFAEEYNGLAVQINAGNEEFLDCLEKIEEAFSGIDSAAGKTVITPNKDGFTIKNDILSVNTAMNEVKVTPKGAGGKNGEEGIIATIEEVKKWYETITSWLQNLSSGMDLASVVAETQSDLCDKAYALAESNYTKYKSVVGGSKVYLADLKDIRDAALLKKELWKDINKAIKAASEEAKRFKATQVLCGASIGSDLAKAYTVNAAFIHRHPVERERNDAIRKKYAEELNEAIGKANGWLLGDIGLNVGTIAWELGMIGKGSAFTKLFAFLKKFRIGAAISEQFTKIMSSKWAKRGAVVGNIAAGVAVSSKADKYFKIIEEREQILHGDVMGVISGKVVDADTKKPIEGVLVSCDGGNAGRTKADGSYAINVMYGAYEGEYALKYTMEGYMESAASARVDEKNKSVVVPVEMMADGVPIDDENFPDDHFREAVKRFDLDKDDFLSNAEIAAVKSMNVDNQGIKSLTGIGFFTALETLSCVGNELTKVEINECAMLKKLDCSANSLKSLNVSGHPKLESLKCDVNPMTMLSASGCANLKEVDCSGDSETGGDLTGLDVSGCSKLETLKCSNNSLKLVSVEGCTGLKTLNCSYNELEALNGIEDCTGLEKLYCNTNALKGLQLNALTRLQVVNCGDNSLTRLSVGMNTNLEELNCAVNQLQGLDLTGCSKLSELYCSENELEVLNTTGCVALETLDWTGNDLKRLYIIGCTNLSELDYSVDTGEETGTLELLDASGCAGLSKLNVSRNALSQLNVSGCTGLRELDCIGNKLTKLDVSGCPGLEVLDCGSSSNLTSLIAKDCTKLWQLRTNWCSLEKLDVSGCTGLEELDVHYNKLTSLDISSCASLREFICYSNGLTGLDVSGLAHLSMLYCQDNELKNLNLTGCAGLRKLYCHENHLSSLTISGLTNLEDVQCQFNDLSALDVSGLKKLTKLSCNNNLIASLDVTGCTGLKTLDCSANLLFDKEKQIVGLAAVKAQGCKVYT